MKKRKIIIISAFLLVAVVTAIYTVLCAVESYRFDMDPANGIDILEGFGAGMLIVLGGFIIICETDLFFTVYYFLTKPKTIARSILNVLSTLCLLLVFLSEKMADLLSVSEEAIVPVVLVLVCLVLRAADLALSRRSR